MSELSDFGRLRFATGATSPESDEDAADMSVKRMWRATKYDDGDSSMNGARGGGRNRGSERRAALNGGERARKCQARRLFAPQPNTAFSDEAICAGLRPAGVLVYAKRLQGRANRPYQKVRTVGRIDDAVLTRHVRCKKHVQKQTQVSFLERNRRNCHGYQSCSINFGTKNFKNTPLCTAKENDKICLVFHLLGW